MTCSVCGEPALSTCPRIHREWTIIRPAELERDDILLRPDGTIYQVLSFVQNGDEFLVRTGQRKHFVILYAELPILVKRPIVCGWPRCELHCGKCFRYSEEEQNRERLLPARERRSPPNFKSKIGKSANDLTVSPNVRSSIF